MQVPTFKVEICKEEQITFFCKQIFILKPAYLVLKILTSVLNCGTSQKQVFKPPNWIHYLIDEIKYYSVTSKNFKRKYNLLPIHKNKYENRMCQLRLSFK